MDTNTTLIYQGPGTRIDQFLSTELPYSRNFFHHLIKRGAITVQRTGVDTFGSVKKSYKLKQGDTIAIESMERFIDGGILDEAPAWEIDIRHEEKDYLVLYKPKGVLSHPNSVRDIEHKSIVGGVYHYFKGQGLPSMGSFIRAGLVHRLDKDTDGLMIVAKTEKGLTHFKRLFQRKSGAKTIKEKESVPLKKRYRATCVLTESGSIFLNEIRNSLPYTIQGLVTAKVPHTIPKEGITKIMEIVGEGNSDGNGVGDSPGEVTFLIEILTGRTHQIRVHLSEKGLPIVGDYLYGVEEERNMMLSAVKLEFEGVDGEKVVIKE